jgi:5-methylcytosine-specific restriction endonuclease McrA
LEKVERVCQYCGKTFLFPEYRIAYGMGKYCSHKCADTANRHPRVERVTRVCKKCGKTFTVRKQELLNGSKKGVYCSMKCTRVDTIVRICPTCNNAFEVAITSDKQYCSKKCSDISPVRKRKIGDRQIELQGNPEFRKRFLEWVKQRTASDKWRSSAHFQKGANHPAYKGNASARESAMGKYEYKQWRKYVFMRDCYTCQNCGAKGVYLHAHHIKHWAEYPELRFDVSNGITLCVPCHKAEHAKSH